MSDWGEWEWKEPTTEERRLALLAKLEAMPPRSLVLVTYENGVPIPTLVEDIVDSMHMQPWMDAALERVLHSRDETVYSAHTRRGAGRCDAPTSTERHG